MDDSTFDHVAKTLAGGLSRRRVVQLVGGGLSGALAGLLGRRAVSEAQSVFFCTSTSDCASLDTPCVTYICQGFPATCQPVLRTGAPCTSCFQNSTCQADGTCGGSTTPVVCTPLDQCHVAGVCDPTTGTCSNPAAPDGTPCNADNNPCTLDTCQAGTCVVGPAVVCPAPDLCHTAGTCDPASGVCSAPTLVVQSCVSGKIKSGPCDCDGTCCAAGQSCIGRRGVRRCA